MCRYGVKGLAVSSKHKVAGFPLSRERRLVVATTTGFPLSRERRIAFRGNDD